MTFWMLDSCEPLVLAAGEASGSNGMEVIVHDGSVCCIMVDAMDFCTPMALSGTQFRPS